MQHKAVYLLFCKFTLHVSGCQPHPSSGVHKTLTTVSGTCQIFCAATSLQCIILQVHSTCFGVSTTSIIRSTQNSNYSLWYVPETVVRVLCTPDDGCG